MRATLFFFVVLAVPAAWAEDAPKFPDGLYPSVKVIPAVIRNITPDATDLNIVQVCFGECNDESGFVFIRHVQTTGQPLATPDFPMVPETSNLMSQHGVPGIFIDKP